MQERKIQAKELPDIVKFISGIDFFKKLEPSALKEFAKSMSIVLLEGGETLINQGDLDPTMYILYNGRLRVYVRKDAKSETKEVGEISVGQIVGEIALLTSVPRTGTVRAIRDSMALKLSESSFQHIEKKYPGEVIEIAKMAIKRLVTPPRPTQEGENVRTIAVAPAGDSDHRPFIKRLVSEFHKIKPTLLINRKICEEHFKQDLAQTEFNDPDNEAINQWLTGLEQQYGYIIYETDRQMTPWTKRCLRQADKCLLIADDTTYPVFNSIEINLFTIPSERPLPCMELIIIHPDDSAMIKGSTRWLKERKISGFHHLKLGSQADFAKLMRFLNGKAIGLVLNGGGFRALAHAGVIKALCEMNFPIDFVGGASMGGFLAAAYASKGLDDFLAILDYKRMYSLNKDFTFPLISLLKGKNITDVYIDLLGEHTCIEDLSTRFFCVSANVTESRLEVHDRGLLCHALRATTAIPAVFPPYYNAKGCMLVDGGILNNMPVNVMRRLMCGGKIIAVNSNNGGYGIEPHFSDELWKSGWSLLYQKLNPFSKKSMHYDSIFQILRSSFALSADSYQDLMSKQADFLIEINTSKYGLFGFDDRYKIVELGYDVAKDRMSHFMELQ